MINKKRNQSAIDIEKDLSVLEQQQQKENIKIQEPDFINGNNMEGQHNNNSNNYSFDQNKNNQNHFSQKQNDNYYGGMMKNMDKDNLNYINSLMQKNKQNELRNIQKKAHHTRTKSSLGSYQTGHTQNQQQADLNTSLNNGQLQREYKEQQQSLHDNLNKNHTYRNSNLNENNQDTKENNMVQQQQFQPQIQQKSLSHRSLNETLPIFSKQNKNQHENGNGNGKIQDTLKHSNHSISQQDQKGQGQNNLSFKIESERKSIQQQYLQQQQNKNKFINSDSISANETNYSTGISIQKTDQVQFLQFLGNYVTYLSQPDDSPSLVQSKPNSFQMNFFNSHNSSMNNNNNRNLQQTQKHNLQVENQNLLQQNQQLQEQLHIVQQVVRDLNAEKNLTLLEFSKLQKEKSEYKKKSEQLEKVVQQLQLNYNDVLFKLKHTKDNLAKITIDHETQKYTFQYALQQFQAQQLKNSELSFFNSNSKNSFSSQNFNFTSKGKESNHDLKFEGFENNSHFFNLHNQKYQIPPKMQPQLKSPINLQKTPQNMNRQNFQQENIYEEEAMLNNTGIFNYTNQHIIGEQEEDVDQHNISLKPQIMSSNIMDYNQGSCSEQEIDYENDENLYNNQYEGEQQYDYSDLQHSQNVENQSFINYHNANQAQQRNKKYNSLHMRNPSSEEKHNVNESYYHNFLQNKMIDDVNNKSSNFQFNEQMQNIQNNNQKKDMQYKAKNINLSKNSGINSSQTSKIHFNSSNLIIPSGDYYQDISQTDFQNNSLQLHQLE